MYLGRSNEFKTALLKAYSGKALTDNGHVQTIFWWVWTRFNEPLCPSFYNVICNDNQNSLVSR